MIAILKYNAGNVTSVAHAVQRLGYETIITNDPKLLQQADKIIFPGVGEASSAMHYLQERNLDTLIQNLEQPVLGICLGMQLMCQFTEEGNTKGLGIFENIVQKFPAFDIVPHIGWNNFSSVQGSLFQNLQPEDNFYYVHSYCTSVNTNTIATTNYIIPFSSALQKNNFYATQFHPEKSGKNGSQLLQNFLSL